MHLFLGFAIMYGVHKIPYRYFRGLSMVNDSNSDRIVSGYNASRNNH